jgi:hypothetical protein
MEDASFSLSVDPMGGLRLVLADGCRHDQVLAVRAFPFSSPSQEISLLSADGQELLVIPDLAVLPGPTRCLLERQLREREFVPIIRRIVSVSSLTVPSTWTVATDRGSTQLRLKSEDDIRSLGDGELLICDAHGVRYLISNPLALDRPSRRLLARFL